MNPTIETQTRVRTLSPKLCAKLADLLTRRSLFHNICPSNGDEPEFFCNRFLAIEILDLNAKIVGIVIWDTKKEILHGPVTLRPEEVKQKDVLPTDSVELQHLTSPQGFLYVDSYGRFKWKQHGDLAFLTIRFQANNVTTVDILVSEFEKGKIEWCELV